jgi:fumarate reductase subunit D
MSEIHMEEPRPAYTHAFWWGMFAQGGIVAALTMPALILVSGILGPLGIVPYLDGNYKWFSVFIANWLVKLVLFVVISLTSFHTAHRFHFWLHHLGVHGGRRAISMLSYAAAAGISLAAVIVLVTSP